MKLPMVYCFHFQRPRDLNNQKQKINILSYKKEYRESLVRFEKISDGQMVKGPTKKCIDGPKGMRPLFKFFVHLSQT